MSEVPPRKAEHPPGQQQQQPQATPSSGVGADSAMEVLKKKRPLVPEPYPPRAGDAHHEPKPR